MTLGIVLYFGRPELWWLAIFDFVVHFSMDRIKAGPKWLGRFKAVSGREYVANARLIASREEGWQQAQKELKSNVYFWWSLGLDQMVHHCTDLCIVYMLCMNLK